MPDNATGKTGTTIHETSILDIFNSTRDDGWTAATMAATAPREDTA